MHQNVSLSRIQANIIPVLVTNHSVTISVELVCEILALNSVNADMYRRKMGDRLWVNATYRTQYDPRRHSRSALQHPPTKKMEVASCRVPAYRIWTSLKLQRERKSRLSREYRVSLSPILHPSAVSMTYFAGLFYINAYGHEINPTPNPDFLAYCGTKDVLVYSCGSLWTREVNRI